MSENTFDAVDLAVFRRKLEGIAEEMGSVLIQGAFSPNITERQDCSTAIFDATGNLVAQAEHIPVHLGAMPAAVEAVLDCDPRPGDVFILNDPFQGGTHLPDVTLIAPISPASSADVTNPDDETQSQVPDDIIGYAVSRAHHADVGGPVPGSMPAGATDIHGEGLRLPPVRYVENGTINDDVRAVLMANVREPDSRQADLRAQLAATERGGERVGDLFADHGERLLDAFEAIRGYSRRRVRAELRDIPDGTYAATDYLEGDGIGDEDIPIAVTVRIEDATLTVDFEGTATQVPGNVNAPLSVANSAVYYVIRCVTDPDIPPNQGCYEPVTVTAPRGSLVNPTPPAAVAGGNVETSQRIVDIVFAALAEAVPERVPAGGQGTMNNLIIGDRDFQYYETIGGGAGGTARTDGLSGVQVGVTNTLNTPVEALEVAYPLHVTQYALRSGSGGAGTFDGGDGLVRSIRVDRDATLSLLTDRRRHAPRGVAGGMDGTPGRNLVDGEPVGAKVTRDIAAGSVVTIETPGGGGYGRPAGGANDETDSNVPDE